MSKINLDKKLSDFELLTKLHSERKDYYSNNSYTPVKQQLPEKESIEDIDLSFMKPIIKFLFYFLLLFVGMPLFVSWNVSVLLGTPMDAPFHAIKTIFNFISSITAEQFAFGFIMFLGAFFMVGPFALLFSCNCSKNDD